MANPNFKKKVATPEIPDQTTPETEIAQAPQIEAPAPDPDVILPAVEPEVEEVKGNEKINSDEEALAHAKEFVRPDGVDVAYVTSDGNVFYDQNSAWTHKVQAKKNLFTVTF